MVNIINEGSSAMEQNETLKERVQKWNLRTNERQKLQHVYLAAGVIGILFAGIVTLLFPELGHQIVLVALGALSIFVLNGVVWSLLQTLVINKLPARPRRK